MVHVAGELVPEAQEAALFIVEGAETGCGAEFFGDAAFGVLDAVVGGVAEHAVDAGVAAVFEEGDGGAIFGHELLSLWVGGGVAVADVRVGVRDADAG